VHDEAGFIEAGQAPANILSNYFSFTVTNGNVVEVPVGLVPHRRLTALPLFLRKLPGLNWREEQPCFVGLLREFAALYAVELVRDEALIRTRLMPEICNEFAAPRRLAEIPAIVPVQI
jgi:hypothetical protein